MNNQEERGSFCFTCAVRDPHFSVAQQKQLRNSWPLLIDSQALGLMRSQPLIYLMYSATPVKLWNEIKEKRHQTNGGKPTPEDIIDFYNWYIWLHEFTHLWYLSWTPAKEVAKIHLASCYACVFKFLYDLSTPTGKTWQQFAASTERLDQVHKSIGFVEELIATAHSIRAMEVQTYSGEMWAGFQDELEVLKHSLLESEEKSFPGFKEAYKRIEPLIKLMWGNRRLIWSILPLLQPIFEAKSLTAPDAYQQLSLLLEILEDSKDADDVYSRLQDVPEQREKLKHIIEEWGMVLAVQTELLRETEWERDVSQFQAGMFLQKMWHISWGNDKQQQENSVASSWEEATQAINKLQNVFMGGTPLFFGQVVVLQPEIRKEPNFISMHYTPCNDALEEAKRDDHIPLLFYEAIRQQITARKGFVCFNQQGKRKCQCSRSTRTLYQRLGRLALDGVFGDGEWSMPPCFSLRRGW